MTDDVSIPAKVSASFRQLEAAATQLNTVSDELGKYIAALDVVLKRLNLGISSWVKTAGDYDNNTGHFWKHELGYAKVDSKWGIALRIVRGDAGYREEDSIEAWLFNDAPRALRVEAVDLLPALLEGLIEDAKTTAEEIKNKIGHAQQVVAAIKEVAEPQPTPTPHKAAIQAALTGSQQAAALRTVVEAAKTVPPEPRAVSKAHPPVRPVTGIPYSPLRRK